MFGKLFLKGSLSITSQRVGRASLAKLPSHQVTSAKASIATIAKHSLKTTAQTTTKARVSTHNMSNVSRKTNISVTRAYHSLAKAIINNTDQSTLDLKQHVAREVFSGALANYQKIIVQHQIASAAVFISHAWGSHDALVENMVEFLRTAGVKVSYDKTDIKAGSDINAFVTRLLTQDRLLIAGTLLYRTKATTVSNNINKPEPGLAAEARTIVNNFSTYNTPRREMLLPVVLEGTIEQALPPLMFTPTDLAIILSKTDSDYFIGIFDILNAIYKIMPQKKEVYTAIEDLKKSLIKELAEIDNTIKDGDIQRFKQARDVKNMQATFLAQEKIRKIVINKTEEVRNTITVQQINDISKSVADQLKLKLPKIFNNNTDLDIANLLKSSSDVLAYIDKILTELSKEAEDKAESNNNKHQIIAQLWLIRNKLNKAAQDKKASSGFCVTDLLMLALPKPWKTLINEKVPRHYQKAIITLAFLLFIGFMAYPETKEKTKNMVSIPLSAPGVANKPRKALSELRTKMQDESKLVGVAITGFPGSGKTELAKLYAHEFAKQNSGLNFLIEILQTAMKDFTKQPAKVPIIWYLDGSKINTDYIALAQALNISVDDKKDNAKEVSQMLIDKINKRLSLQSNWLLVFNDISDYASIKKFLAFESGTKGKVLITTRNTDFYSDPSKMLNISNGLELDEAVDLLQRLSGAQDRESAVGLVNELDRLPLAITTAALYIKRENEGRPAPIINFAQYKVLAVTQKTDLQKKQAQLVNDQVYPLTQSATVQIVLNRLQTGSVKDKAVRDLLSFCSLINVTHIPRWLLESYWQQQLNESTYVNSNLTLNDLLVHANTYSLINLESKEDKPENDFYYIHHAIQNECLEQNAAVSNTVLQALETQWTSSPIWASEFNRSTSLTTHTEKLLAHISKQKIVSSQQLSSVLYIKNCLANHYCQINRPADAKAMLIQEKNRIEQSLQQKNVDIVNPVAVCQALAAENKQLPRRYAHLLYILSRASSVYMQQPDTTVEQLDASIKELDHVIALGAEIDSNKQAYDDRDNPQGVDTGVYQRQGKAFLHILKSEKCDKQDALTELNRAETLLKGLLINSGYNEREFKIFCFEQLGKVYSKKAKYVEAKDRQAMLGTAVEQFACAAELLTGKKDVLALLDADYTALTRASILLDKLGDVYCEYNDAAHTTLAKQFFEKALNRIPKEHYKDSHIKIHHKLAKIYGGEVNKPIALVKTKMHLNYALTLIDQMRLSDESSLRKEAKNLQTQLDEKDEVYAEKIRMLSS